MGRNLCRNLASDVVGVAEFQALIEALIEPQCWRTGCQRNA